MLFSIITNEWRKRDERKEKEFKIPHFLLLSSLAPDNLFEMLV